MSEGRFRLELSTPEGALVIVEPTPDDVRTHAAQLRAMYNDSHNRSMMGHDAMTEEDVVEHFADMRQDGARAFLFFLDDVFVGDGDLRGIEDGAAELAIMIGARASQGRGLGTRFAMMLHAFAFRTLALSKVYVGIIPGNDASRRLFEKLGYKVDESPEARAYADHDSDVMMSTDRAAFEAMHAAALDAIVTRRC
jgi:RimJ/RimL family protein N-acetyltransferase